MSAVPISSAEQGLIDAIRRRAPAAAVLSDVDGTLAPIAARPELAAVAPRGREALLALSHSYALVGCVSGRRALEARRIVGLDELHYIGNHGYELLAPGASKPRPHPALTGDAGPAGAFLATLDAAELDRLGIRREDKGPIQALHWRGSEVEAAAVERLHELATRAETAGLVTHWGRKVLELRPPAQIDKGSALRELLGDCYEAALYAGDDTTDLDAFAALRALVEAGCLATAICVGVGSDEGPLEIIEQADIAVAGVDGVVDLLERLAVA